MDGCIDRIYCCGQFRMCCLSPYSVAAIYSHWSHLISKSATEFSTEILVEDSCSFLATNSSLLLAFLLRVVTGFPAFLLVSKEKENPELTVKEKLKAWQWPCCATAWQKSMHLEAREVSTWPTHCSHFDFTSELRKSSSFHKTCCCSLLWVSVNILWCKMEILWFFEWLRSTCNRIQWSHYLAIYWGNHPRHS